MHMHTLQQFFLTNPDNFFLTFSYIGFPQTSVRAYLPYDCLYTYRWGKVLAAFWGDSLQSNSAPALQHFLTSTCWVVA